MGPHPSRRPSVLARRLRELGADQRGNVIVYVSLTTATLMGLIGLALDGSRAMVTHAEAQAAADAAARAGASQLDRLSGACARAKAQATSVTNRQRFAQGGSAPVTIAAGSPVCLNGLPASDAAATTAYATTTDSESAYIQVTTQQVVHQNTFLAALTAQNTVTIQRSAVAGFRQALCANSPVMMACSTIVWTPGVAFDAWSSYGGNKGFLSTCGNSAGCVADTLAATQPSFCVSDGMDPAPGNKTNKAQEGVNVRFGLGTKNDPPADIDVIDFSNYSSEVPGAPNAGASGWNCEAYWTARHAADGLPKPAGCTTTAGPPTTRYAVYQAERAAGKIPVAGKPPAGIPTTPEERRLLYLAIYNCDANKPVSYLKTFMIGPAKGTSTKTLYVEPVALVTSKTDPTVVHEEVQLYR
ncbi:pilus assembly protein TadG-related protein [Phenylobacterium sp.]|jgi:Flp pilus assembly protein TadG|uniref:pilus assembly protein TadG-related protein n=1 Tax=Phenylobacterium sp. TaxID=1871053 RepID=UPI0037834097